MLIAQCEGIRDLGSCIYEMREKHYFDVALLMKIRRMKIKFKNSDLFPTRSNGWCARARAASNGRSQVFSVVVNIFMAVG